MTLMWWPVLLASCLTWPVTTTRTRWWSARWVHTLVSVFTYSSKYCDLCEFISQYFSNLYFFVSSLMFGKKWISDVSIYLLCHLFSLGWRYWGISSHSASCRRQRRHHRTSYLCPASPHISAPGRRDGTECCQTALRPARGRQITASAITLATH